MATSLPGVWRGHRPPQVWASLEACPAGHGCDDALTGVFLSRKTDVGFSVLSLLCPGGGSLPKSCPLQQPRESQDEPRWPPVPGASGVSPPGLQLQNHRAAQVHGLPQEMRALAASGEAEASVKRAPGSRPASVPRRTPGPGEGSSRTAHGLLRRGWVCASVCGPHGVLVGAPTAVPWDPGPHATLASHPAGCSGGSSLGTGTRTRAQACRGEQHARRQGAPVLAACPCHLSLSPVLAAPGRSMPARPRELHRKLPPGAA